MTVIFQHCYGSDMKNINTFDVYDLSLKRVHVLDVGQEFHIGTSFFPKYNNGYRQHNNKERYKLPYP